MAEADALGKRLGTTLKELLGDQLTVRTTEGTGTGVVAYPAAAEVRFGGEAASGDELGTTMITDEAGSCKLVGSGIGAT